MIQKLILDLIAPEECLSCRAEGSYLCDECLGGLGSFDAGCFICDRPSIRGFCTSHSSKKLSRVIICCEYSGRIKELIHGLKFSNRKSVARVLAKIAHQSIEDLPESTIVSYIPTATKRVRSRGYDQSELIAREFAKLRGLDFQKTLLRLDKARQLGKKRSERLKTDIIFKIKNDQKYGDVLLIDDVITTGSTAKLAIKAFEHSNVSKVYLCAIAKVPL